MNEQFAKHVAVLSKSGEEIRASLSASDAHLLHMAILVPGEAGELADAVKRATIYRKPIDIKNVIEELGDLAFGMQGIMNELGITWEQVMQANFEKLAARYPSGYSDKAAQDRADKASES